MATITPIQLAIQRLEKKYGPGVVMDLNLVPKEHPHVSTGHAGIDRITGIGGLPQGKMVELFGYESTGKSTLAIQTAGNLQAKPWRTGRILYLDFEHAFDVPYANHLGMKTDPDHFLISQPEYAEQGLEVANEFVEQKLVDMIICDSVAAMLPEAEMAYDLNDRKSGQMGHAAIGSQSRVVGQGIKQLAAKLNINGVLMVFINQIRVKLGGGRMRASETTTGGNALKFYTSMRIQLKKISAVIEKERMVGMNIGVTVVKNKLAAPFSSTPAVIRFGQGFDIGATLFAVLTAQKVLIKGRTGFYDLKALGVQESPRGDAALMEYCKAHPEFMKVLMDKVDWSAAEKLMRVKEDPEAGEQPVETDSSDLSLGDDAGTATADLPTQQPAAA
jgi:recombination protein RecA